MHWEPCEGCGEQTIIFDLTKTPTGYRCDECSKERIAELAADPDIQKAAEQFIKQQQIEQRHPLQVEFGFDKPEDGSERRFVFSATKAGQAAPWQDQKVTVPWVKFRFWWLVHNAVAHPLIAVAPRRTFFRFHDYTSRKMHGIK
jgi:ssDNA-binding Zn-finger/Zn-ribbon topoisomerase 1